MDQSTTLPIAGPTSGTRDVLTELLRDGARRLMAEAVEAEVAAWIDDHARLRDQAGHRQVVRNGYLPEREIQTGLGDVQVKQPRGDKTAIELFIAGVREWETALRRGFPEG